MLTSPVTLSRSAHQTWTHAKQTDPHGTSMQSHTGQALTRDAHKRYSSLHIKLSCVCGIVSCLISPVDSVVCMLATSINVCAVLCGPLAHGMSMRPYRLTQSSLTGGLHRDRPSTSSRCRHALIQHSSHPGDDSHAPQARACLDMPQWHTPYMGKCPRTHGRWPCGCSPHW